MQNAAGDDLVAVLIGAMAIIAVDVSGLKGGDAACFYVYAAALVSAAFVERRG